MKKKFYGVFASNGMGVYTNYKKLLNDQKFMRSEHLKSFKAMEDAVGFAVEGFEGINGIGCELGGLQDIDEIKLNFFYYRKKGVMV